MFFHFDLQLMLLLLSTPLILSADCKTKINSCFSRFESDLEKHKVKSFTGVQHEIDVICNATNGYYTQFVRCVTDTESQCSSHPRFEDMVCETRKLRLRVNRYKWTPNLFYQICRDTSSPLSIGIIKHHQCISFVLNQQKWTCDENYDRPRKTYEDWRANLEATCSLWTKFRDCSKQEVKQKCGTEASDLSDYLFHNQQTYYNKYSACNLSHTELIPNCRYKLLKVSAPAITELTQTTTSTESVVSEQTLANNTSHSATPSPITTEPLLTNSDTPNSSLTTLSALETVSTTMTTPTLTETSATNLSWLTLTNDTKSHEDSEMWGDSNIRYLIRNTSLKEEADESVTVNIQQFRMRNAERNPSSEESRDTQDNDGNAVDFSVLLSFVTAIVCIYSNRP